MARPEKNSVDYFPYICSEGEKMYYLEETYGNDGFATFVKILIALAKTEYHYLNLSKMTTLMFLSAKCKISKDILESIIKDLVDLGKFDSVLWNENKIIWCQDFINSIQDAYNKRKNKCITYEGLLLLLISLGVRKPPKSKPKVPVKPQSIVEYSKKEYKAFAHLKITNEENDKLIELGYNQTQINSIYSKIENFRQNTKYKSLYLTSLDWLKREFPNINKPTEKQESPLEKAARITAERLNRT